jgi:hypothetical protein
MKKPKENHGNQSKCGPAAIRDVYLPKKNRCRCRTLPSDVRLSVHETDVLSERLILIILATRKASCVYHDRFPLFATRRVRRL